jgi:hypothetical protein
MPWLVLLDTCSYDHLPFEDSHLVLSRMARDIANSFGVNLFRLLVLMRCFNVL